MNELQAQLDRFLRGDNAGVVDLRPNPPEAKLYEFLEVLSEEGKLFDYSEQDWIEAGRSEGLTDDQISDWIETAASWLEDTTEEGEYEPEPAAWA